MEYNRVPLGDATRAEAAPPVSLISPALRNHKILSRSSPTTAKGAEKEKLLFPTVQFQQLLPASPGYVITDRASSNRASCHSLPSRGSPLLARFTPEFALVPPRRRSSASLARRLFFPLKGKSPGLWGDAATMRERTRQKLAPRKMLDRAK